MEYELLSTKLVAGERYSNTSVTVLVVSLWYYVLLFGVCIKSRHLILCFIRIFRSATFFLHDQLFINNSYSSSQPGLDGNIMLLWGHQQNSRAMS